MRKEQRVRNTPVARPAPASIRPIFARTMQASFSTRRCATRSFGPSSRPIRRRNESGEWSTMTQYVLSSRVSADLMLNAAVSQIEALLLAMHPALSDSNGALPVERVRAPVDFRSLRAQERR